MTTLFNPYAKAIKKYIYDIIPKQYTVEINDTLDRITHNIATQKDAENLTKILSAFYQAGFDKAIEATKEAVKTHGMNLTVVPPKQ